MIKAKLSNLQTIVVGLNRRELEQLLLYKKPIAITLMEAGCNYDISLIMDETDEDLKTQLKTILTEPLSSYR
jgi:hypothetical protein